MSGFRGLLGKETDQPKLLDKGLSDRRFSITTTVLLITLKFLLCSRQFRSLWALSPSRNLFGSTRPRAAQRRMLMKGHLALAQGLRSSLHRCQRTLGMAEADYVKQYTSEKVGINASLAKAERDNEQLVFIQHDFYLRHILERKSKILCKWLQTECREASLKKEHVI